MSAPGDRAVALRQRLKDAMTVAYPHAHVQALCGLAAEATGYLETIQLDRALGEAAPSAIDASLKRLRVAVLSSATIDHLLPGIRVAGVRRGFYFEVFAGGFGQYRHELMQPSPRLREFAPDIIVLSLSGRSLVSSVTLDASADDVGRILEAEVAE